VRRDKAALSSGCNVWPYTTRQPSTFAPCQRRKKIINPLLLGAEPGAQVMRKGFQRRRR
jgi:hypothetical protein